MRHGHPWRLSSDKQRRIVPDSPSDEFDELVVGSWFHMERLDTACWFMQVGACRFAIWREKKRGDRPARWRMVVHDNDGPMRGARCSKCGNEED